jgi:hypothetical protein
MHACDFCTAEFEVILGYTEIPFPFPQILIYRGK